MSDSNPLRNLPSVEQLLASGEFDAEIAVLPRPLVVTAIRDVLQSVRDAHDSEGAIEHGLLTAAIRKRCRGYKRRRITRVINGSGVLVHTNLGRAPLGREIMERLIEVCSGYSTLEFDLESGKRGRRGEFLSFLLAQLTGAEAALAVNNNAAALFLILNSFTNKREVIVSRSELVQIGGGFRIPDIISRAGAKLVEVGTTNQTTRRDYENAIAPKSAMLLKVHQSNFAISGFVAEATASELALLARNKNLLSVYDLGSGAFLQTEKFGMTSEPTIQSALKSGCQLVCFSGDKLLGGTQAGIILGHKVLIEQLHRNPLYRVLRLDKLTLALLEEIVIAYLRQDATTLLPLWRYLSTPLSELRSRAEAIIAELKTDRLGASVQPSLATPGGGSLPGGTIASIAITLKPKIKLSRLQRLLLDSNPPLVGHVESEQVLLDLRTIDPTEDQEVVAILNSVASCIP